jgi:hypothetical protein
MPSEALTKGKRCQTGLTPLVYIRRRSCPSWPHHRSLSEAGAEIEDLSPAVNPQWASYVRTTFRQDRGAAGKLAGEGPGELWVGTSALAARVMAPGRRPPPLDCRWQWRQLQPATFRLVTWLAQAEAQAVVALSSSLPRPLTPPVACSTAAVEPEVRLGRLALSGNRGAERKLVLLVEVQQVQVASPACCVRMGWAMIQVTER